MRPEETHDGFGMTWVGQSIERVEDAALLTGRGRYIDDLGVPPGTLHAAVLRSPHPHAVIRAIDVGRGARREGRRGGDHGGGGDRARRAAARRREGAIQCWPIAVERVRYVGEPVAVVVAADRYLAEDALELIEVDYEPLPITLRPADALKPDSAVLHDGARLATSRATARSATAIRKPRSRPRAHRVSVSVNYPRNSCTPIETYGLIADYDPGEDAYDILATFQGPFSIHAVLARALKVPGNRLRLRMPPDAGGSFGVKQGIFPYIALMGIAARVAGRPVKWIEDRLEHLTASVSATNRLITLRSRGRGRRPRHGARLGPGRGRRRAHPRARARHALSHARQSHRRLRHPQRVGAQPRGDDQQDADRTQSRLRRPAGLLRARTADAARRGRAQARSARRDPAQSRSVAASFRFAPRPAACSTPATIRPAWRRRWSEGGLAELRARQTAARAEGRLYGIGLTAVVEPSVSNMGYITTVLTPEERRKAGPKNGAQATATIALDPGGAVSVHVVVGAAGAGPSHRGVADRRRRARAEAVRHPRRHRHGHGARRLVDRVGQLCEPLRAGGRAARCSSRPSG